MKLKEEIFNYLQTQNAMSISTSGKELWPAIVYYIVDEELNLYFTSNKNSLHSQNIASNSAVTCTIYDSSQQFGGDLIGIQLRGKAKMLGTFEAAKQMVQLWNKTIAKDKKFFLDVQKFKKAKDSRVYKVTPEKIKFFNTKLFKKESFKILPIE